MEKMMRFLAERLDEKLLSFHFFALQSEGVFPVDRAEKKYGQSRIFGLDDSGGLETQMAVFRKQDIEQDQMRRQPGDRLQTLLHGVRRKNLKPPILQQRPHGFEDIQIVVDD